MYYIGTIAALLGCFNYTATYVYTGSDNVTTTIQDYDRTIDDYSNPYDSTDFDLIMPRFTSDITAFNTYVVGNYTSGNIDKTKNTYYSFSLRIKDYPTYTPFTVFLGYDYISEDNYNGFFVYARNPYDSINVVVDYSVTFMPFTRVGTSSVLQTAQIKTVNFSVPLFSPCEFEYYNFYYPNYIVDTYSRVIFNVQTSIRAVDTYFYDNAVSQDSFDKGLEQGYSNGERIGWSNGYNAGKQDGISIGKDMASSMDMELKGLLGVLIDSPILFLRKLFDYQLFGISIFGALATIVSLLVALSVFRLIRGVF